LVQTTMLEDVSHATRCCSLHTSTSTQDLSVVHAPILPHSNLSWQTSNKTSFCPVLTLFFFLFHSLLLQHLLSHGHQNPIMCLLGIPYLPWTRLHVLPT
jgi:hypothetical protein